MSWSIELRRQGASDFVFQVAYPERHNARAHFLTSVARLLNDGQITSANAGEFYLIEEKDGERRWLLPLCQLPPVSYGTIMGVSMEEALGVWSRLTPADPRWSE